MLYPQENKIRGIIDLNGVWDFALGTTEKPGDAVTLPEQMEPISGCSVIVVSYTVPV